MKPEPVLRDERILTVENASYRLAFMIANFGMLILATYRSFVYQQDTWDLLGLVVLSNLAAMIYQARGRAVHRRLIYLGLATAVVAAVVAFVLARVLKPG